MSESNYINAVVECIKNSDLKEEPLLNLAIIIFSKDVWNYIESSNFNIDKAEYKNYE